VGTLGCQLPDETPPPMAAGALAGIGAAAGTAAGAGRE